MTPYDVVVVGAGHAGAHTAIALRREGFTGTIALVGEECDLPYERPPLSKDYLLGDRTFDTLLIRPAEYWAESGIDILLNTRISAVDPANHLVCAGDRVIGYGRLVWATGGSPRELPCGGHHLDGVHTIRTRADIDRIVTELGTARSLVVIGGGYIGLEAAAAVTKRGDIAVTVIESADRVLARVAAEPVSRFYEAEHRARGVEVELGVTVTGLDDENGRVSGVRLSDGRVVPADLVVVGIGIRPATAPLEVVGLAGEAGVEVDGSCRTVDPDIYAVGDCTLQLHAYAGPDRMRIESVQNATDQAAVVARAIAGSGDTVAQAVPRFWSDQYDLRLQTSGVAVGYDEVVLRGDPGDRAFSVGYLRDGVLVALDTINRPVDFAHGRKLVANRVRIARTAFADIAVPLSTMAAPVAG